MTIIWGGDGPDNILGTDAADSISGGGGDDVITGGAGADRIDGGDGIDTVNYTGSAGVRVDLSNTDGVGDGLWSDAEGDVLINVENVLGTNGGADVLIGSTADNMLAGYGGNDQLIGFDGNDTLLGGDGDDLLEGGTGVDHLDGGDGNDTADFHTNPTGMFADISTGVCLGGEAEGDTMVSIENVIGGGGDDSLFGDAGANLLVGHDGNDILYGRDGNDTLRGGSGDDLLQGGAGADMLDGGDPTGRTGGLDLNDTVSYDASGAGVTVDLGAGTGHGGDAEGDTLIGIENVIGSRFDDTLTGSDTSAGTLNGGAGNDVLRGGVLDHLDGSAGIDTASYFTRADGVTVDLAAGTGHGGAAQLETLVGIENLSGSQGNDTLIGDAGANTLQGWNGDDMLQGGAGADHLDGGAGTDTARYDIGTIAVSVNLTTGIGSGGDAQGDTLALIENLIGSQGDDTLIGSGGANTLDGGKGNDTLQGMGGDDVLRGGAGADHLDGGLGTDTASYFTGTVGVTVNLATGIGSGGDAQGDTLAGFENLSGSQGNDTLTGTGGANTLEGWNGADTLQGGAGNDILQGDAGHDTLAGGDGADRFVFNALSDSVVGANADRITDFSHAAGDVIDLHRIDADSIAAGNQAFLFIGTDGFSHFAGELRYAFSGADTVIAGDVNGDGASDFQITLAGHVTLTTSDFML